MNVKAKAWKGLDAEQRMRLLKAVSFFQKHSKGKGELV